MVVVLHDGKFVAAQACEHIRFAQRCLEASGRFAQQRVADRMTKRIVDMLESIEIQQQDRERIAPPAVPRDRLFDLVHDRQAIGEACQNVVMRHERDALLRSLSFGDVIDDNQQMSRDAASVTDHDAAGREDARLAIREFDVVVIRASAERASEGLGIRCVHPLGVLPLINLEHRLPENVAAVDLEHCLKCAVDEYKFARDGIFHDDRNRNVFNN